MYTYICTMVLLYKEPRDEGRQGEDAATGGGRGSDELLPPGSYNVISYDMIWCTIQYNIILYYTILYYTMI